MKRSYDWQSLVVVIVIIPIMLMMPTAAIHIPPSVVLSPAPLPRLMEFMAPVIRLRAEVSMMLDGFMELVICPRRPPPAIAIVRVCPGRTYEQEHRSQRRCRQYPLS